MDERILHKRLLWILTVEGLGPCIGECSRDVQCASVFFNKATKKCQGHSITHGHSDGAEVNNNTRYYVQPFGENYIGDSCTVDSSCVTRNSECRKETCGCQFGYGFSPGTHECLADCDSYGPGFTEIPNFFISHSNIEEIDHVSLEECLELCRSSTEYTCRTLEYGWSSETCSLQNVTKLHEPDAWHEDTERKWNISHFQRDCA